MSDGFSKIVAIILAVVMMYIIPVFYTTEEAERLKQTRILEEITFFVDGVRNTGILCEDDYKRLEKVLYSLGGGYRVKISHYSHILDENGDGVIYNEIGDYEEQIYECFNRQEDYYLKKHDYLKVVIMKGDDEVVAWYGGSVKYEAY